MQMLGLNLIHSDDVQDEVKQCYIQFESLKNEHADRLDISIHESVADISEVDVIVVIVWSQLTQAFEEQLNSLLEATDFSEKEILFFKKQAKVAVDLSDRELLIQSVEQKEKLEAYIEQNFPKQDIIFFDTTEEFEARFAERLEHIANRQLGLSEKAIGSMSFRPKLGSIYLERPRLLELLPDSAGYVVWLEAPYGYGKSILAAQWAKHLEDNWRIIWLSAESGSIQSLLTDQFGLPPTTFWEKLLEKLWFEETLLVLEDLKGDEDVSKIIDNVRGLVLLASRSNLNEDLISQLQTQSKLIHIQPSTLAFTEHETQQLFLNAETAKSVWEQTQGWSLPLHFSFLTGELPTGEFLVEGIKNSLRDETWKELLFLSTLPSLPESAAIDLTLQLASANFVQTLENAYRVHPMVAEQVKEAYPEVQKKAAIARANRITPLQRGYLFESLQHYEGLINILEDSLGDIYLSHATDFMRWHQLAPEPISSRRLLHFSRAQITNQYYDEGLKNLQVVMDSDLEKKQKMFLLTTTAFDLAFATRFEEATNLLEQASGFIPDVSPYLVSTYYGAQAELNLRRAYHSNDRKLLESVENSYDNALEQVLSEPEHPQSKRNESTLRANIANYYRVYKLDIKNSLDIYLQLIKQSNISSYLTGGLALMIAISYTKLMNETEALKFANLSLEKVPSGLMSLEANMYKGYVEKDIRLIEFVIQECPAEHDFGDPLYFAMKLRTLRRNGEFEEILKIREHFNDIAGIVMVEYAYAEAGCGKLTIAQQTLQDAKSLCDDLDPEALCQWHTANFMINRDETSLDALLEIAKEGAGLFRYLLIPVDALPKQRPELSTPYPIEEVLNSGWQEAIEYRMDDVPKLELLFLGRLEAYFLNEKLELTDRQKQILCLLILGLSREQIAETMWPETDVKKQRNNFNVQLNLLRKTIEPWGVTTYLSENALNRTICDYVELQKSLEEGNALEVFELYQEPFAPGIDLEVVSDERERLREAVIDVLLAAANDTEDITIARRYLVRVVELEPLHEEALQSLLKLLIRQGRRREARQRYSKFAAQLKDDLGLEPLEATTALIQI